jgi:hypothetical protein
MARVLRIKLESKKEGDAEEDPSEQILKET